MDKSYYTTHPKKKNLKKGEQNNKKTMKDIDNGKIESLQEQRHNITIFFLTKEVGSQIHFSPCEKRLLIIITWKTQISHPACIPVPNSLHIATHHNLLPKKTHDPSSYTSMYQQGKKNAKVALSHIQ